MAKTTIEFSETAIAQLDQLGGTLHATKAEILRNALSLYAYIVQQLQEQPDKMLGIVNESQGQQGGEAPRGTGRPIGQCSQKCCSVKGRAPRTKR